MAQPNRHSPLVLKLVIWCVALNGLLLIAGTLFEQFHRHVFGHVHTNGATVGVSLIAGLTLLYLSSLLARRKQTAWLIVVPVYSFVLGLTVMQLVIFHADHPFALALFLRNVCFPVLIVASLLYYRSEFYVKSDIQSFRKSLPIILTVLVVTFIYGTVGFTLMDDHDFHKELGVGEAMHQTIDQFGLTTQVLTPYSQRARIFVDSLSLISIGAVAYALLSFVQPLRARFINQGANRQLMRQLLQQYPADSDDFFKIWPHDKLYYVHENRTSALALHVRRGVALVVGDPAGDPVQFPSLIDEFNQLCRSNDWQPAFIHVREEYRHLYESHDFSLQKIGEEAIINIDHSEEVLRNKYFRHIKNKFEKLGYTTEVLQPPYSHEIIERLRQVSDSWLSLPGRVERGFMMGYFSPNYIQQCQIFVARNSEGVIDAFMNVVPTFDNVTANYDLLRHAKDSPGNINDLLLMAFINAAKSQNYKYVNLGLCPLSGLEKGEADHSTIDGALRFIYANGDRFYSFSGLKRFKAKYEPEWSPRYMAYRGGIRGFMHIPNALNQSMKVKEHKTTV